jgi:pyruvate/2-oxoglutarate dehydrogenase complex dihydrolipoamide dehydrogenase (E3) component
MERYDMIVIGGGAAGINAAKTAASLKARVILVDRGPLGGTCVNRG